MRGPLEDATATVPATGCATTGRARDRTRQDPAAGRRAAPAVPPPLSTRPPHPHARVHRGALAAEPRALAADRVRVRDVLRDHARACTPEENV